MLGITFIACNTQSRTGIIVAERVYRNTFIVVSEIESVRTLRTHIIIIFSTVRISVGNFTTTATTAAATAATTAAAATAATTATAATSFSCLYNTTLLNQFIAILTFLTL